MFIFHAYSLAEFLFIAYFYFRLTPTKSWRYMLLVLTTIYLIVTVINLVFLHGINEFNSYQRVIEAILVGVMVIRYLADMIKYGEKPSTNLFFFQTAGFLIYFSGTIFLFSFGKEILKGEKNYFWLIHGAFNILLNISFTITLWKARIR